MINLLCDQECYVRWIRTFFWKKKKNWKSLHHMSQTEESWARSLLGVVTLIWVMVVYKDQQPAGKKKKNLTHLYLTEKLLLTHILKACGSEKVRRTVMAIISIFQLIYSCWVTDREIFSILLDSNFDQGQCMLCFLPGESILWKSFHKTLKTCSIKHLKEVPFQLNLLLFWM